MDTKHTPGPWVVMPRGHNGIEAVQVWPERDGEGRICTMMNSQHENANARLIAAAPELLDACKKMLDVSYGPDHEMLCAVIAKAEGRR